MTLRPFPKIFETYRRVFLPYCLHLVTPAVRSQDQRWVILNRFYKPLGIGTYTPFVDYALYAVQIRGLTDLRKERIACHPPKESASLFLYSDGCIPDRSKAFWDAYTRRLSVLQALEINVDETHPPRACLVDASPLPR